AVDTALAAHAARRAACSAPAGSLTSRYDHRREGGAEGADGRLRRRRRLDRACRAARRRGREARRRRGGGADRRRGRVARRPRQGSRRRRRSRLLRRADHAGERLFEWGDARELDLKGKSEPVAAWPVAGAAAASRTQRGLPGVETRLVGRSRELGLGREALEALRAGRGGVLVVAGDAGIGKTRLLNELRALAEREGSSWLEGRCVSYGESLPYWPFRDLLRGEWIGAGAEEPELRVRVGLRRRLEQLFDGNANELYPYLGGLLEVALEHEAEARTSQLSPEALQWRTFEVVGQLFARLAESAPLVLALEDLHWADPTSVLLLEQLLSLAEEA